MRIIAHLDMDAFYATAELIRNPRLAGLPVAVGGRRGIDPLPGAEFPVLSQYQGRGVLTTANYEARKLGLRSAMPTMQAAKLAPNAVLLPADFEWYKTQSRAFKSAVLELAPVMENRGIDEIYLDLTEQTQGNFAQAERLAAQLKQAVSQATGGMTCSIGLSANKMTSKIASDLQKPNGLTVVRPEDFQKVIWPLPVGRINGVGPKAQAKLQQFGIGTVAQLAQAEPQWLIDHFGSSYGHWLHQCAWGIDLRELDLGSDPKSMSRETTFEHDMHVVRHRQDLTAVLQVLTERLAQDMQRKSVWAKTVGVKVRFGNFKSVTRDFTPPHPVHSAQDLLNLARVCLKKMPFERSGAQSTLRLLGVKATVVMASDVQSTGPQAQQLKLFE